MFHVIKSASDIRTVAHGSRPSLKDRLRVLESQNKELRSALEDMTHTLRQTQELLVYAISNLNKERAARRHRGVESARQSLVAPANERLDIRKVNCSNTQPTKLTIDYIMNVDRKNRAQVGVKQEPLTDELVYPEDVACPYPSPPPSQQNALESLAIAALCISKTQPQSMTHTPTERRNIEQTIPLIPLPEPQRCRAWMQAMFVEDHESEIGQIEFWTLYKDAFSALAPQFPLLSARELLQRVSEVFPYGQAIEASGSMLMQRYVVSGVRRRF